MTDKYTKNPVEVQAVQFTFKNKDQVYTWAKNIQMNIYHGFGSDGLPILKVPTLEGNMECCLGDYLIVEPFPTDWRKIYPCKEEIFNKTYTKSNL